jgi:hypothetical protein
VITPELLAELAMETESEDSIDWGMLAVDERAAYNLMASHVLEMFQNEDKIAMMASITKLVVENFVLNLRLQGYQ